MKKGNSSLMGIMLAIVSVILFVAVMAMSSPSQGNPTAAGQTAAPTALTYSQEITQETTKEITEAVVITQVTTTEITTAVTTTETTTEIPTTAVTTIVTTTEPTTTASAVHSIGTVYITPYGEKYHFAASCAGKNAMARDYNDVKDSYGPCKKCTD